MESNEKINTYVLKTQLKSLELNNFRRFTKANFSFQPNVNVIIGRNGAGKTTLVEAIAKQLQCIADGLSYKETKTDEIYSNDDINYEASELENEINVDFSFFEIEKNVDNELDIELSVKSVYTKEGFKDLLFSDFDYLNKIGSELNIYKREKQILHLPVLLYYGLDSIQDFQPEPSRNKQQLLPSVSDTYKDALLKGKINFSYFFEWFRWQEQIEFQLKGNKMLDNFRNVVCTILSNETDIFEHLHTDWLNNMYGMLMIEKNGQKLKINQLSSGEMRIFEIAVNIMYRLAVANQGSTNPLNGNGIVLIDEIDMHLHPEWQQRVVHQFTHTFPNIQFIFTTHSPDVLSSVLPQNIIDLQGEKPLYSKGLDPNRIHTEIMRKPLRITEIQAKIDLLSSKLNVDNFDKTETLTLFDELKTLLGAQDEFIMNAEYQILMLNRRKKVQL